MAPSVGSNYIRKQTFLESVKQPEAPRILKKTDEDKFILSTSGVYVKTFDLKDDKDIKDYASLLAKGCNKRVEIMFLSRHWDENTNSMKAYAEWREYALS